MKVTSLAREIPLGDMALLVARRLRRLPEGTRIHDCPCTPVGLAVRTNNTRDSKAAARDRGENQVVSPKPTERNRVRRRN